MTHVKCIRCGVVNVGTDDFCKACAIELNPVGPPFARPVFVPYQPRFSGPKSGPGFTIIRPFNGVSDVVGPTLSLFTKNVWLITKISFVIVAPFEVFKTFTAADVQNDWQWTLGMFVLGLLCNVLIAPALIYALMRIMQTGTAPGINEAYRWGASKLGKLIVCAASAWVLQALGFALCVIPGIMVGMALMLVYPLAILEKRSASNVLLESTKLTKGHRWNILGATIVIGLLWAGIILPIGVVGLTDAVFWPVQVVASIGIDILMQLTTVLSLVIYLSIRRIWEPGHSVIE